MYVCDLTFRAPDDRDAAISTAFRLAASLMRSGQFLDEYIVGWIGADLRITGEVPLPNALDEPYRTRYVRQSVTKLEEMSRGPVAVHVHPLAPGREAFHTEDLSDVDLLILRPQRNRVVSPLWDPDGGEHVPLYLVPMDADERERIVTWAKVQNLLEGVWFHSPTEQLELDAYRERARADSASITTGREHARAIEDALGVPVYTWLDRHYGAPEGDDDRPCPGCGGSWRIEWADEEDNEDEEAPFRCEPCRLASDRARSIDEEDWGRFAPVS